MYSPEWKRAKIQPYRTIPSHPYQFKSPIGGRGFDVMPQSEFTTLVQENSHTDMISLIFAGGLMLLSNCMCCDLLALSVRPPHISHCSVSSSQAPAMALYWCITSPVAFFTKNLVSTHVKSGKTFVFCAIK